MNFLIVLLKSHVNIVFNFNIQSDAAGMENWIYPTVNVDVEVESIIYKSPWYIPLHPQDSLQTLIRRIENMAGAPSLSLVSYQVGENKNKIQANVSKFEFRTRLFMQSMCPILTTLSKIFSKWKSGNWLKIEDIMGTHKIVLQPEHKLSKFQRQAIQASAATSTRSVDYKSTRLNIKNGIITQIKLIEERVQNEIMKDPHLVDSDKPITGAVIEQ